nr:MAG TPA: RecT protein [Caudoviricetes sp.]
MTARTLTVRPDQDVWDERQLAALQSLGMHGSPAELAILLHHCQRTGLDPWARQIHLITRGGRATVQVSIDGMRLVADRVDRQTGGHHGYEETLWCSPDGEWRDVWLADEAPAAAKVTIVRDGHRIPVVAHMREYMPRARDGKPIGLWRTMPALMLAKCAEALALRRAYPQDLSGLYTSDEMAQSAPNGQPEPPATPVPEPPRRASRQQLSELRDLMADAGLDGATALALAREAAGRPDLATAADLTPREADRVAAALREAATEALPPIADTTEPPGGEHAAEEEV